MRSTCRLAPVIVLGMTLSVPSLAAQTSKPDGKALYQTKCALCHGKDGAPLPAFAKKNAPDLRDAAWQKRRTDEQIRKSIAEGVPGSMMLAFGKRLTRAEIDALVAHVRTLQSKVRAR